MTTDQANHSYIVYLIDNAKYGTVTIQADKFSSSNLAIKFFLGDEVVAEFNKSTVHGWHRISQ